MDPKVATDKAQACSGRKSFPSDSPFLHAKTRVSMKQKSKMRDKRDYYAAPWQAVPHIIGMHVRLYVT
jgi:hypothetical protein